MTGRLVVVMLLASCSNATPSPPSDAGPDVPPADSSPRLPVWPLADGDAGDDSYGWGGPGCAGSCPDRRSKGNQ